MLVVWSQEDPTRQLVWPTRLVWPPLDSKTHLLPGNSGSTIAGPTLVGTEELKQQRNEVIAKRSHRKILFCSLGTSREMELIRWSTSSLTSSARVVSCWTIKTLPGIYHLPTFQHFARIKRSILVACTRQGTWTVIWGQLKETQVPYVQRLSLCHKHLSSHQSKPYFAKFHICWLISSAKAIFCHVPPCFRQLFEESREWHLVAVVQHSSSTVCYPSWHAMVLYGIVWLGLLSVMAIRKEKHGHIGRLRLYNA